MWWDRKIPFGKSFDAVIEKALWQARCLIVLWSTALRNLRTRAKGSDSQDLPPGDDVFALDATGVQPIPATVRNGQATTVTP